VTVHLVGGPLKSPDKAASLVERNALGAAPGDQEPLLPRAPLDLLARHRAENGRAATPVPQGEVGLEHAELADTRIGQSGPAAGRSTGARRRGGQLVGSGVWSRSAPARARPLSRHSPPARIGDDGARDTVSGTLLPVWPEAWGLAREGVDMVENRRSKRAIRSRMAETGEKYTEARRALLAPVTPDDAGGAASDLAAIADQYLAEIGAHQDAWVDGYPIGTGAAIGERPDELRDLDLLRDGAQPVIWVVIKLSATGFPGADLGGDADWAAMLAVTRRDLLSLRRAGVDAGLVDSHLRLIDIVRSRIGFWPQADWAAAVRGRVEGLLSARDSGRRRRLQARSSTSPPPTEVLDHRGGWTLRHPPEHYFSRARACMTNPALRGIWTSRSRRWRQATPPWRLGTGALRWVRPRS
jgi:hypothetical protein